MLRILEISWLSIALLGLGLGGFKWWSESFSTALWFFILALVALAFWLVRRRQRILMQKNAGNPDPLRR
jgi:hypothetical protein